MEDLPFLSGDDGAPDSQEVDLLLLSEKINIYWEPFKESGLKSYVPKLKEPPKCLLSVYSILKFWFCC